ncbi:MAG: phosphoribosylformylglycinamidine synthase subunit PurQ / glutaminase [Chthoniobacter sp.]|jgi:phosphoribosylformylglycinamidine synthase|nr:phosphoribosylformylglycinamidine synthase subunit PurQ / glutaminase [Chthoniobacter sp.]
MKAAVIRFPGSNCDQDCHLVLRELGVDVRYVWHKETSVADADLIVLPGGFSYGDYLRCGAIARFSPVMQSVKEAAAAGTLVLGICNGFQILCEAGLLPGALIRNRDLHFICEHRWVRVENIANPFLNAAWTGTLLNLPIAHGEGCYVADATTLQELNRHGRVLLRYTDGRGAATAAANPNGSAENIAGICNAARNIFGLMPHPERAADARLGSVDGRLLFESILTTLGVRRAA